MIDDEAVFAAMVMRALLGGNIERARDYCEDWARIRDGLLNHDERHAYFHSMGCL